MGFVFVHQFQVVVVFVRNFCDGLVFVHKFQTSVTFDVVAFVRNFSAGFCFVFVFQLVVVSAHTFCDGFCFCAHLSGYCRSWAHF